MTDRSDDERLIPLDQARDRRRRLGHSPYIINGRPADLQPLAVIDPISWIGKPVPERRWLVPDLVPEGNVTMLGGDGGIGKSLLAMQLLAACSLGKSWIDHEARHCKAVGIFCEDDADELHRRMIDIVRHYGSSAGDLEDLKLACRVGMDNLLVTWAKPWEPGETTALYARVRSLVLDHGAELLVLDSLHDLFGGDENSRPMARQFIGELRSIAIEMRGAVVLTSHPSKDGRATGSGEAGSTAWNNAVRSRLYLTAPKANDDEPDRDYRELRVKKSNYAGPGGVIRLRWRDGVFVREDAGSGGFVSTLDADHHLVEGLRELIRNGATVPADPHARRGFANAVRDLPSCRRYSWTLICAAQSRLLDQGKLVRVEMGPPSRRHVYIRPADMTYPSEIKEAQS